MLTQTKPFVFILSGYETPAISAKIFRYCFSARLAYAECMYLVYVTCPEDSTAHRIAEACISKKLAACANILPGVTSIYEWEGKIQQESETLLLLKTSEENWPELESFIASLHPYDIPALAAYSSEEAFPAFAQWVQDASEQ